MSQDTGVCPHNHSILRQDTVSEIQTTDSKCKTYTRHVADINLYSDQIYLICLLRYSQIISNQLVGLVPNNIRSTILLQFSQKLTELQSFHLVTNTEERPIRRSVDGEPLLLLSLPRFCARTSMSGSMGLSLPSPTSWSRAGEIGPCKRRESLYFWNQLRGSYAVHIDSYPV